MPPAISQGIAVQVDKIRAEIRRHGESRVGCDELSLLCPNEVSDAQGLHGISEIAEWERWTFEYLPDGNVRFSNLPHQDRINIYDKSERKRWAKELGVSEDHLRDIVRLHGALVKNRRRLLGK
jgi:Protein of unknown function (DUF3606)